MYNIMKFIDYGFDKIWTYLKSIVGYKQFSGSRFKDLSKKKQNQLIKYHKDLKNSYRIYKKNTEHKDYLHHLSFDEYIKDITDEPYIDFITDLS